MAGCQISLTPCRQFCYFGNSYYVCMYIAAGISVPDGSLAGDATQNNEKIKKPAKRPVRNKSKTPAKKKAVKKPKQESESSDDDADEKYGLDSEYYWYPGPSTDSPGEFAV